MVVKRSALCGPHIDTETEGGETFSTLWPHIDTQTEGGETFSTLWPPYRHSDRGW